MTPSTAELPGPPLSRPAVPAPRAETAGTTPVQDGGPVAGDRYAHLEPLWAAWTATSHDTPARARLRAELIKGYLPVAHNVAHRYAHRGEPVEDLQQVAALGLLHAVDRFDPTRGCQFLGFAIPTITGEIRRHFRDRTWAMRVPRRVKELHTRINQEAAELAQQLGRSPRPSDLAARLHEPVEDILEALQAGDAYSPDSLDAPIHTGEHTRKDVVGELDPRIDRFVQSHSLGPALASLPRREHDIVIMRFFRDMTQTQIARELGLSQMHISRLLSTTCARLRDAVDNTTPPADGPSDVFGDSATPPTVPGGVGE
jgi:RNA polymerase sigma-B factor